MKTFGKLNYSLLPTPIHKLENLSHDLNANIYCKRDDMTGFAYGGNKTRKLDYLIYEAIQNGADTIIAVGAYQSNFCRIASAFGAATGLEVWLVLGGNKPQKATGNLMLDYLFGAQIFDVASEEWNDWENEALKLKEKMEKDGKKVFLMPIGGSTETGALGYIDCMKEITDFAEKSNIKFGHMFHATGTGGTQSGLIIGKNIFKFDGNINSIAITKNAKQISEEVNILCKKVCGITGANFTIEDIYVDDNYIGKTYGAETKEANDAIDLFAKKEGILLDRVYTGKAAAGMIDYIRNGQIEKTDNILFIHTGGNVQLFK